jgi:hypothetical protein
MRFFSEDERGVPGAKVIRADTRTFAGITRETRSLRADMDLVVRRLLPGASG